MFVTPVVIFAGEAGLCRGVVLVSQHISQEVVLPATFFCPLMYHPPQALLNSTEVMAFCVPKSMCVCKYMLLFFGTSRSEWEEQHWS